MPLPGFALPMLVFAGGRCAAAAVLRCAMRCPRLSTIRRCVAVLCRRRPLLYPSRTVPHRAIPRLAVPCDADALPRCAPPLRNTPSQYSAVATTGRCRTLPLRCHTPLNSAVACLCWRFYALRGSLNSTAAPALTGDTPCAARAFQRYADALLCRAVPLQNKPSQSSASAVMLVTMHVRCLCCLSFAMPVLCRSPPKAKLRCSLPLPLLGHAALCCAAAVLCFPPP